MTRDILRAWRRVLAVVVGLGALAVPVATATPAAARSIGAYPSQVVVASALRGSTYLRTIGILDDSPTPDTFTLTVTGAIAPWVTFVSAQDQTTVVKTVQAHAGPPATVLLRIRVPAQAANSAYEGTVHITSSVLGAAGGKGSGQKVNISDEIPVGVVVSGTQHVAGTLLDAYTVPALEVGYPLRVFTVITNTGNVEVRPSVHLVASRNGQTVYDHISQGDPVDPGVGPRHIETDWADTSGAPVGNYVVRVDVAFPGTPIGTRDLKVQMVPYGSLRRQGTLDRLMLANKPSPGGAGVVQATVHNTGQIEAKVVFHGELRRNGQLVSGVTSVPVLTLSGTTNTISVVVNSLARGSYSLTGQANFDGKESNARTLDFRIGAASGPGILPFAAGGGAVVLIVLLWWWRRRRAAGVGGAPGGHGGAERGWTTKPSDGGGGPRRPDRELVPLPVDRSEPETVPTRRAHAQRRRRTPAPLRSSEGPAT